jgi:hypothetical protein
MTGQKGAQKGNQNARKHGFYSNVLDELELKEYEDATQVQGFDEEIALMRVKIKSLAERQPDNVRLIMQAIGMLTKLVMIKYNIRKEDKQTILQSIGNVLKNIVLPAGIDIIELINKLRV